MPGFGVPMAKNATKDDLRNPIARGVYALSTKDRHIGRPHDADGQGRDSFRP